VTVSWIRALALLLMCAVSPFAAAHASPRQPHVAASASAPTTVVHERFATAHRVRIAARWVTFLQVGFFSRRNGSVRYALGPGIRCLSGACPPIQSLSARHFCAAHGASGRCTRLTYLSALDIGGKLGYRQDGSDRELYLQTDIFVSKPLRLKTYIR
jgi:hypothetical protein